MYISLSGNDYVTILWETNSTRRIRVALFFETKLLFGEVVLTFKDGKLTQALLRKISIKLE